MQLGLEREMGEIDLKKEGTALWFDALQDYDIWETHILSCRLHANETVLCSLLVTVKYFLFTALHFLRYHFRAKVVRRLLLCSLLPCRL